MVPPMSDGGRQLTEKEVIELRLLLEKEKRITWFWSTIRVWAGWTIAIVGAYFTLKSLFIDVLAKLVK